jgi:maleate isomerase
VFGWRKRIGYISPTVMEVLPYEFYRFAPDGVGLVGVTCMIDDWRPEEFEKGLAQVKSAAAYLGSRNVDFVIHGGGPLVVARGPGYEETIVREIAAASGVPATTGVRSGMEALRAVNAGRIVIASPYPPRHDEALAGYLKTFGFEILEARGANLPFKDLQVQKPTEIYDFVKRVIADNPSCDTVYLPCPQWQSAQVVAAIEEDTGKTAVAYTHANFYVACTGMGVAFDICGHGRLLASLSSNSSKSPMRGA